VWTLFTYELSITQLPNTMPGSEDRVSVTSRRERAANSVPTGAGAVRVKS
jgi:hypothetical protein